MHTPRPRVASTRSSRVSLPNTELSRVDSARVCLENGWVLNGASGAEPVTRLTAEGESLRTAKKIIGKGVMLVEHCAGKVK